MRGAVLVGLGCAWAGCVHPFDPPTRLQLGVRGRHFATAAPADGATSARTAAGATEAAPSIDGVLGNAHFTMATRYHAYLGGEVEVGTLGTPGSNAAAVSAIAGAEGMSHFGSVGVELAGGWRTMRYSTEGENASSYGVEPRVRGEIFVGPQISLGALAGAGLRERTWMAGLFLGIHSHDYGEARDR